MGELAEFSTPVRLFLRAYRWRRIDPVPLARLPRPLSEARLALVSTAGLVTPEQEAFDGSIRGGDYSFRVIPGDVEVESLLDTQRSESYDHSGIAADRNLAFPLDRLRELQAGGRVGSLAKGHLSFMGSITAPGRLLRSSAPQAADLLVSDRVEAALLVPV